MPAIIKNVSRKEEIDSIFDTAKDQQDYLLALYWLWVPNFDKLKQVDPPVANKDTNLYIIEKCMAFDKRHHPQYLPGGLWLRFGFNTE